MIPFRNPAPPTDKHKIALDSYYFRLREEKKHDDRIYNASVRRYARGYCYANNLEVPDWCAFGKHKHSPYELKVLKQLSMIDEKIQKLLDINNQGGSK